MQTANFDFLELHDAKLVQLGGLAERYFRDDPFTCLFKLRQFAELVAKLVAAHQALYVSERETFEETLRRLSFERAIPRCQRRRMAKSINNGLDFARACLQLGGLCTRTDQNQTRNTVLFCSAAGTLGIPKSVVE